MDDMMSGDAAMVVDKQMMILSEVGCQSAYISDYF